MKMSLRRIYMKRRAQRSRRMNQARHGSLIYFSDSRVKVILGHTIYWKHELAYLELLETF